MSSRNPKGRKAGLWCPFVVSTQILILCYWGNFRSWEEAGTPDWFGRLQGFAIKVTGFHQGQVVPTMIGLSTIREFVICRLNPLCYEMGCYFKAWRKYRRAVIGTKHPIHSPASKEDFIQPPPRSTNQWSHENWTQSSNHKQRSLKTHHVLSNPSTLSFLSEMTWGLCDPITSPANTLISPVLLWKSSLAWTNRVSTVTFGSLF